MIGLWILKILKKHIFIRVSEYIKHGCELAKIHIYLQDTKENSFIKVSREFDRRDRSSWKLNGKPCLPNDIQNCIKKFNIQVCNDEIQ